MTWIVEEPLTIAILGGVTLAFLAFSWTQTRYRALAYAMLVVATVTAALLIVEYCVESETEQIEATLNQIAADVESNDLELILSHIYSGASNTYRLAKSEFPKYEFERADVKRNVEVTFEEGSQPRKAVVTFNVVVVGYQRSLSGRFHVPRFVKITLVKEAGKWKVEQYEHHPPQHSLLNRTK